MASQQVMNQLKAVVEQLKSIDRPRLLRSSIGEESLEQVGFDGTVDKILKKAGFALEYGTTVDDNILNAVMSTFNALREQLTAQTSRANAEYVSQKAGFITTVTNLLQQLQQYWCHFISAAIEARGFLEDEGIRKEYDKAVTERQTQAGAALKHVQEESAKTIPEATKLAEEIEQPARRPAPHISAALAPPHTNTLPVTLDTT